MLLFLTLKGIPYSAYIAWDLLDIVLEQLYVDYDHRKNPILSLSARIP